MAWVANEWRKQYWELYKRKEESYKELLKSVRGYYDVAVDTKLKAEFLHQLDLCWLYCTDEVIKRGYDFLNLIRDDIKATDKERNKALSEFVLSVRNDIYPKWWMLFKKSKLTREDFKIYRVKEI